MAPTESDIYETAPEDSPTTATKEAEPVLIYVGSAENDFAHAGTTIPLRGINRVRFGRSPEPGQIVQTTERSVMRVGVPTMWASSTHTELTLNPSGSPVEQEIKDLGSRNGTIVEGKPIAEITALASGQLFEIGRSFWMVRRAPAPLSDEDYNRDFDGTGTGSPLVRHAERALARLAPGNVPILLVGETGCGKEHLARAIHRASGREGEFARLMLAGAPVNRIDALMFGDPDKTDQRGAVPAAVGGTLFIDDVSDLSREAQSKLLWALTEHPAMQAAGGEGVRLISGSLRELGTMVLSQRFRADLYSRLAGYEARIPSLRERREDLGLLTNVLLKRLNEEMKIETPAFRRLLGHPWPFNVRELDQSLAAAASVATDGTVISRGALNDVLRPDTSVPQSADGIRAMRQEIVRQLVALDGDTKSLAQTFGVDADQIERWLERFDIQPENYRGLS